MQKIKGDIFNTDIQYIAQQCNCVTTYGRGLFTAIKNKYKWADTYSTNKNRIPGTIDIKGNGKDKRFVINMYAQKNVGKHSFEKRIEWFKQCLYQISQIDGISEIAFPYKIGCGMGGGDWSVYRQMIKTFSDENPNIQVFIIKL